MESKDEIIKNFKKKIDLLKKHNFHYFNNDAPIITDAEYDAIKIDALNFQSVYFVL